MSKFLKQEWLSTAEQFETSTARVIDVKLMIEYWCGNKKKTN